MTWSGAVDVLRQDVRYAWRSIARTPGFALLVVLTFTLGIGVNAASFSVLDTLFLKPPSGVQRPEELRRIWQTFPGEGGVRQFAPTMTGPQYRALAELAGPGTRVVLYQHSTYRLGDGTRRRSVQVAFATANYFSTLGVRPALGRFYTADEDRRGSPSAVVVLSDHLWRSHFGGDTAILGRRVRLGGTAYTIIGVAPASFGGVDLRPMDLWIPIAALPKPDYVQQSMLDTPGMFAFFAFFRAPPGFDVAQFERRASTLLRDRSRRDVASPDTAARVVTASIIAARGPGKPNQERLISTRLAGVAGIVLLIACANVVNLFLARGVRRRREIAVRLALGVSRARLAAFLATETTLLALIAGLAALLAAWWAGALLRSMLIPEAAAASVLDARVSLFTLGVAAAAGVAVGIVPAFQVSRPDLTRALKAGERDGTIHRSRLRNGLIVAQGALSVVLLVGAALFVRSLRNVEGLDLGYDVDRLIFAWAEFDRGHEPPAPVVAAAMDQIARRLESGPGVEQVTREGMLPMMGMSFQFFYTDGDSVAAARSEASYLTVSAKYFSVAGLRVLRGSVFDDRAGAPKSVVVNEAMAKAVWPGRDPIGRCIRIEKPDNPCYRVVGVVETARRFEVIEAPKAQYYLPLGSGLEGPWAAKSLMVRAHESALPAVSSELTAALGAAFPNAVPSVLTLTERLESQYRPWRLGATLFTAFGLLALVVALVGIYSTLSYAVSLRTHEFGVRVALGARLHDVLTQVVGEGLRVVALGVVVGIGLALAAGRLVTAVLYGVQPSDPAAMLLAAGTLLVVAAVAAAVPAWRAARVDPSVALRAD